MKSITVTSLRKELFHVIDDLKNGEIYEIVRKGKIVGRITPAKLPDWRDKVRDKPKLLMDSEAAFSPLFEEWKEYL